VNKPVKRRSILPASPLAPLPAPQLDACAVTTRFGVAELLGLMVLYALVFGLLSLFRAPWPVFLVLGLFMAAVAVAQALLFRGTRPRRAATLGGALMMMVGAQGLLMFLELLRLSRTGGFHAETLLELALSVVCSAVFWLPFGAVAGYMAGTLMAGVFLVVRLLMGEYRLRAQVSLEPFGPEDADTLLQWLRDERVVRSERWRWAGFPADAQQFFHRLRVFQRLRGADSAAPAVRRYKAVDERSGRMVGYAEIHLTDTQPPGGRLELVCVGPDEPQRGLMGRAMVRELLCEAFEKLDLAEIEVGVDPHDRESTDCYLQAGFWGPEPSIIEWRRAAREWFLRRMHVSKRAWQRRHAVKAKNDATRETA